MEVIDINPLFPNNPSFYSIQPLGNFIVTPGVFNFFDEDDAFLNSLDDETRDYIVTHRSDFETKDDIVEFVNKLREDTTR